MLSEIIREDGREGLKKFLADFQNLNTQEGAGGMLANLRQHPVFFNDFLSVSVVPPPFVQAVVNSGTITVNASTNSNHPGNLLMRSSTSANSGGRIQTEREIQIGGGEAFEIVFRYVAPGVASTTVRAGFHDTQTVTDATDGVYFEIVNGIIVGKTASNSSRSTTVSSYTVTEAAWYRGAIIINPTATQVEFRVYSETGELLWQDSLSSNIPTGPGRTAPMNVVGTRNTMTTGSFLEMDMVAFGWPGRRLVR